MTSRKISIGMVLAVIALFALAQGSPAQQLPAFMSTPQQSLDVKPADPLAGLFIPAAAPKTCGPYCNTFAGGSTPSETGTGASCSDALADLTAQLTALAKADCMYQTGRGICNFVVGTRPCGLVGSSYQIQGIANYNCRDTSC
jgi:hypothetical protein